MTDAAQERFDVDVLRGSVVLEIVAPEEGGRADVAAVRLLARVVAHVALAVRSRRECLTAVGAQEPTVDLDAVRVKRAEIAVGLVAYFAREWRLCVEQDFRCNYLFEARIAHFEIDASRRVTVCYGRKVCIHA